LVLPLPPLLSSSSMNFEGFERFSFFCYMQIHGVGCDDYKNSSY
jgi:hypothetical protein